MAATTPAIISSQKHIQDRKEEEGELPRAAVKGRLGGSFVFPIALGAELTLLQLRQELFLERGLHCQVSTDH